SPTASGVGAMRMPPAVRREAFHATPRKSPLLETPLSSRARLHIMIDAPHPTRRYYPHGTPTAAPHRPVADGPRPPGDRVAVRCRLVSTAHRRPPRLPPSHRPQGPAPVRPAGDRRLLPTPPGSAPRPATPAAPDRPAGRPARPGPDLDVRPTGR